MKKSMSNIGKLNYRYHMDFTDSVDLMLVVENGKPHYLVEWKGGKERREFPATDYIGARACYEANGGF